MFVAFEAAAYDVKQIHSRFKATSGEALTTGEVVCIKDADGYAYKADSDDSSLRPAVGIVGSKTATASGSAVEIIISGTLTGWSSLAEGGAVYLSPTAGDVSQSSLTAAYEQQVGVAISTTDILFDFNAKAGTPTNAAVSGTLAVTGTTTLTGNLTANGAANTLSNTTASGTLTVTGTTTTNGTLDVNGDLAGDGGGVSYGMKTSVVEKTGNYTCTATTDVGKTFTNEGSSGEITFTLPTAATGLQYCFANADSNGYTVNVDPGASDQILGETNSTEDKVQSTSQGDVICLEAVDEVNWISRGGFGTWADAD